jgi:hypothetical protein
MFLTNNEDNRDYYRDTSESAFVGKFHCMITKGLPSREVWRASSNCETKGNGQYRKSSGMLSLNTMVSWGVYMQQKGGSHLDNHTCTTRDQPHSEHWYQRREDVSKCSRPLPDIQISVRLGKWKMQLIQQQKLAV